MSINTISSSKSDDEDIDPKVALLTSMFLRVEKYLFFCFFVFEYIVREGGVSHTQSHNIRT